MFLCKSLCWLCEEWDMKHYQYSCMLLEKWRNKMLFSVLPNVNVTLEESAPPQPRTSPLVPGWYISSSQTGEFRTDRVSHRTDVLFGSTAAVPTVGGSRASQQRSTRERTHKHEEGGSWACAAGAAVAMMQWRLRRGRRAWS